MERLEGRLLKVDDPDLRHAVSAEIAAIEADLVMPPIPKPLAYLWSIYLRLRRRSAPGFNGSAPWTWTDLDSFLNRAGISLVPWEIEVLEALDEAFLEPETPRRPTAPDGQQVRTLASSNDVAGVQNVLGRFGGRRVVIRDKGKKPND